MANFTWHGDSVTTYGPGSHGKIEIDTGRSRHRSRRAVLVFKSHPRGSGHMRLHEEIRAIDQAIRMSPCSDQVELKICDGARLGDLHSAILNYRPTAVHFSGHGADGGGIVVADERGNPHVIDSSALSQLFRLFADSVRCVVLSACLTDRDAGTIAAHVNCVVGMSREVPDVVATDFSTGFYGALASGLSARAAFELGCNQIALRDREWSTTPVLKGQSGVAEHTYLTERST